METSGTAVTSRDFSRSTPLDDYDDYDVVLLSF
jgi:hypothetical protein